MKNHPVSKTVHYQCKKFCINEKGHCINEKGLDTMKNGLDLMKKGLDSRLNYTCQ